MYIQKNSEIQLVVLDIDGVLTDGESAPFDLDLFKQLADLNQRSRDKGLLAEGRIVPPVTVCTGRPQAYVEAVLQALHASVPGVFEGGAGLYVPEGRRSIPHPDIKERTLMRTVRSTLEEEVERDASIYLQPGKEFTVSVFPRGKNTPVGLKERVVALLGERAKELELLYSASCLNILPKGIHKGKGIEFLSAWLGVPLSAILAVGDSEVDIPMFQKVGYRAAPANATPEVKALSDYVSPFHTAQGLRDILNRFRV
ncbi:MAG: Cof-type HAD-IIB family hydrolase [Spirochaetes bacterium]|nr:Cof-type HAD-IIB family hydrolase [Spirochaetota bacterium]